MNSGLHKCVPTLNLLSLPTELAYSAADESASTGGYNKLGKQVSLFPVSMCFNLYIVYMKVHSPHDVRHDFIWRMFQVETGEIQQAATMLSPVRPRPTLLTVQQFCQQHPAFTQGGIRWLLFNREENGLKRAVVQVGRRVLIDVDGFFRWLDEQNDR